LSNRDVDAVEALFNPRRMAVIGASSHLAKWGRIVPSNIMRDGYKGELYLVNPRGGELNGMTFYPSAAAIGKEIDLAMVTIPAENVEGVLEDCAAAGTKVVIAISGGFSESSPEGRALEESMVAKARSYGIRVVGPNTMGIYSAPWSLTALMPPVRPRPGHVAFAAQSGNLGTQMLGWGSFRGIGFSRFVCIGNECDLEFADYLEYFARDESTRVILLYVEGFKRPRRILEIAEEISLSKPIVIYKAAGTGAGSRAAASHSAAMAGTREVYAGMIRQTGMIRAETTEEMLDFSDALVKLPLPRGRRVAILSWGGGWGVVAADLCEQDGLEVGPLPDGLRNEIGEILPSYWSKGNPVDLVGQLNMDNHTRCLELLTRSPEYDMVFSLGTINAASAFSLKSEDRDGTEKSAVDAQRAYVRDRSMHFAQRVAELMQEEDKPIVAVKMPQQDSDVSADGTDAYPQDRLCIHANPERAARVLAMLADRAGYLRSRGA